MVWLGATIAIRGEIRTTQDLVVEGRVEGSIWSDGLAVTVAPAATIVGDLLARDITVFGSISGTVVASEVVDIRETASVTGRVVAASFILADGALFTGTVEPQHLYAALQVARHRHSSHPSAVDPVLTLAKSASDIRSYRSVIR